MRSSTKCGRSPCGRPWRRNLHLREYAGHAKQLDVAENATEKQLISSIDRGVHDITHRIIWVVHIMPHSPRTPRLSSGMDFSASASPHSHIVSPQYDVTHSPRLFQSRRTSLYSIPSPSTSQPSCSHERQGSFGLANGFGGVPDQGNGLGNLADELAEVWDDDGQGEPEEGGIEPRVDGIDAIQNGPEGSCKIDATVELENSPISRNPSSPSSSPTKRRSRPKHHRQFSRYGESDYGGGFDVEGDKDTPLSAQMANIESLARQGVESNGSEPNVIVQRVANSLKDLGSQASLENGATR